MTGNKIRALILSALMVFSVFAGATAFAGSAVAKDYNRGGSTNAANDWSTSDGTGSVGSGAIVYQGEDDITFKKSDGSEVSPSALERTAGDSEGVTLSMPIPETQATGKYDGANTPFTVTVDTPRVSDLEIQNSNGEDVSGGQVPSDTSTLNVVADYNFDSAEDLEITVEDEDGLEVTGEILANPNQDTKNGDSVTYQLDLSSIDTGEYTVTVAGVDDLDFGTATKSATFTVGTSENVEIDLQSESATKGENVRFDLSNGIEGDYHVVAIEDSDVTGTAADVFRNVGDTHSVGSNNGYAYAIMEIDGGTSAGSIETSELDDVDVDVDVFPAIAVSENDADAVEASDTNGINDLGSMDSLDDVTLEVTEGTVTLDSPKGDYVAGSETDVNGTASSGIDEVALYARDEGDFELVELDSNKKIQVDGDDTFEADDVVLSSGNGGGNDILSLPGNYRLAIVAADDADIDNNNDPDATLTTSEVSEATSSSSSIRVVDTTLSVDYVSIINGQIAKEGGAADDLTVNGSARGVDSVSVSFYGPRGTYASTDISTDSDGDFESEDVSIDPAINKGNVVMTVYSVGRDGVKGDGAVPEGYQDYEDWILPKGVPDIGTSPNEGLNGQQLTQQQLIDKVASQTTEDTGSDDLSQAFQFRLADAATNIDSVSSASGSSTVMTGSEAVVKGTTNRQPGDNTISVEVIDGPSSNSFDLVSVDEWGTNGKWSATLNTSGVEPGNYTVEASDGDSSDLSSFQIVEEDVSADVTMNDQDSDGTTVTVADVQMSQGGFIAIHESSASGDVIGNSSYLEPGQHSDVQITLDSELTSDQTLVAMAHFDSNNNGQFEFPDADGPYMQDDAAVTDSATVSIQDDTTETPDDTTETPDDTTETPDDTTETPDEDTDTATETNASDEGSSGDGAGFTAGIALVALLGAALLAARGRN